MSAVTKREKRKKDECLLEISSAELGESRGGSSSTSPSPKFALKLSLLSREILIVYSGRFLKINVR